MVKRLLALTSVLCVLSSPAWARTASVVVDAQDGRVLQAENATDLWYPASLTKVMTSYLVFEAIESGRLALTDKVPVSAHAAAQPPTKLGLGRGKQVSVKLLLRAMIVRSANDAAVTLAEAVAGSEAAFAKAMTRKSHDLGMTHTRFMNASGLPDREQVTTARDMAVLARALMRDFPGHYAMFNERAFTLGGKTRSTTNGWLTHYRGADGVKTGFTCGSGYNLVASARRDEEHLIAVVLGGKSSAARNSQMTKLMNRGFDGLGESEGTAAYLDELSQTASLTASKPPPYVLPAEQCSTMVATGASHLSGWGAIFGSFVKKSKAREIIKRNRKVLKSTVRSGRPAVVERERDGPRRFSALLVGLKQDDAGAACQHLWTFGIYCLVVPPEQLNNPKAIWR